MNKLVAVFLLFFMIPVTHLSHLFLNEEYSRQNIKIDQKFNLPSPEITQLASLGYDNFVADILWLQLIQYIGSTDDASVILPETYSLVNNIITLDPYFIDAYTFGAFVLTDNKEFEKAVSVLEKGIKENPNEWYLPYQLGFLYYIYKKNKPAAARYLEKASKTDNAPLSAKNVAAIMYSSLSTDFEIKLNLWQSVYDKAIEEGDTRTKDKAYKKIIEIKIEHDLETIRTAIAKYNELRQKSLEVVYPEVIKDTEKNKKSGKTGKEIQKPKPKPQTPKPKLEPLNDLNMLVKSGFLKKVPKDPFDRPYIYYPGSQEVQAFPLPLN